MPDRRAKARRTNQVTNIFGFFSRFNQRFKLVMAIVSFHYFVLFVVWRSVETVFTESRYDMIYRLLSNYNRHVSPSVGSGDEMVVGVSVYVNAINKVDESAQEFGLDVVITQDWNETRLANIGFVDAKYMDVDQELMDQIWKPNMMFINEKSSTIHDKYMRIDSGGSILYIYRLLLTSTCPMNLRAYPFDIQTCSLILHTYNNADEGVKLHWTRKKPTVLKNDFVIPQFNLYDVSSRSCFIDNLYGNSSCIAVDFYLERTIGFYLHLPSLFIVLLSWLTFWLDPDAVLPRSLIGVVTVAFAALLISLNGFSTPTVTFAKAIDVWLVGCLMFVFLAVIEFMLVNFLHRRQVTSSQLESSEHPPENVGDGDAGPKIDVVTEISPETSKWVNVILDQQNAAKIDVVSRVLFPSFYICLLSFIVHYLFKIILKNPSDSQKTIPCPA